MIIATVTTGPALSIWTDGVEARAELTPRAAISLAMDLLRHAYPYVPQTPRTLAELVDAAGDAGPWASIFPPQFDEDHP